MNYSFDSLMGQAEQVFAQNPLSGHLFRFLNRERDRIKILFWDQDGFWAAAHPEAVLTHRLDESRARAARTRARRAHCM